jgi:hypothetical protein
MHPIIRILQGKWKKVIMKGFFYKHYDEGLNSVFFNLAFFSLPAQ